MEVRKHTFTQHWYCETSSVIFSLDYFIPKRFSVCWAFKKRKPSLTEVNSVIWNCFCQLKHSVVNTSWAACWLDQRCSASVKLILQHIHGSQLTNETESRRWRANHTILKSSNTLLCHGPAPLLLWQKVDWIALDFFFSLQHVRSVFLGQDQEELGLKRTPSIVKNSFHHQFQHLELHSLQPETEGYRSCGRWSLLTVYLTSRSIYSEDQLSLPSLSRRFKWARRPGRRFGDGLNSIF